MKIAWEQEHYHRILSEAHERQVLQHEGEFCLLSDAPRCEVCGKPMLLGSKRKRKYCPQCFLEKARQDNRREVARRKAA